MLLAAERPGSGGMVALERGQLFFPAAENPVSIGGSFEIVERLGLVRVRGAARLSFWLGRRVVLERGEATAHTPTLEAE